MRRFERRRHLTTDAQAFCQSDRARQEALLERFTGTSSITKRRCPRPRPAHERRRCAGGSVTQACGPRGGNVTGGRRHRRGGDARSSRRHHGRGACRARERPDHPALAELREQIVRTERCPGRIVMERADYSCAPTPVVCCSMHAVLHTMTAVGLGRCSSSTRRQPPS